MLTIFLVNVIELTKFNVLLSDILLLGIVNNKIK